MIYNFYKSVMVPNGTKLLETDNLENLRVLAQGKSKNNLPALYVYGGLKGTFSPTNLFFIDIDSKEGVDIILNDVNKLFNNIPNILYAQKSFSGKLHLICIQNEQNTEEDFRQSTILNSVAILHLIKVLFEVDYFSIENAFDVHNINWTQGLYMSANHLYKNPYPSKVGFSKEQITQLKSVYKKYFNTLKRHDKKYESVEIDVKKYNYYFNNDEKICVDKNYNIGPYSGNDARYRISSALYNMFNKDIDRVKEFIFKHFTNASEFPLQYDYGVNNIIKQWLEDTFHTSKKYSFAYKEKIEKYLTEKYDKIRDIYINNHRFMLKSPTGTGKTTIMKKLANEFNAVVIVPYNTMLFNYCNDEWINGELIKGLKLLNSYNINEYDEKVPCVMVWDQAIKFNLTKRLVISDETHQWFFDRTYRDSAIKLMNKAKMYNELICVSATPAAEKYILQLDEFEFYKEKKTIDTEIVYTKNPSLLMNNIVKEYDSDYDKIVIFSNRYAKVLYENNSNITLMHSITRDTDEFKLVLDEQRLFNKITVCTCLAYNGLNFKNENEKVLVLVDFELGKDTANQVIQAVGRFRSVVPDLKVIVKINSNETQDLEEKINDTILINKLAIENNDQYYKYDEKLLNVEYQNALYEIDNYLKRHSSIESLKEELNEAGYFNLRYKTDTTSGKALRLEEKKRDSNEFKDMVLNNKEMVYNDLTNYQKTWYRKMQRINNIVDLKDIFENTQSNKLVESIFNELDDALLVYKLNDDEFAAIIDVKRLDLMRAIGCSEHAIKSQAEHIKVLIRLRNVYYVENKIETDDDLISVFTGVNKREFDVLKMKRKNAGSNGGKIGGKNSSPKKQVKMIKAPKEKYNDFVGTIFESREDAANKIGVNPKTISQWVKAGFIEKM